MKIKDIADVLDKDNRTIGRWLWDFKKRRLASIFTGHKDNENASKLTHIQKEEIKKILSKKPSDLDSQENFGMSLNLKHIFGRSSRLSMKQSVLITFFLEFGNLSFKYPDKFSTRRNKRQIIDRMDEIYEEIIPLLDDPTWEVFVSDETRMQLEAIKRRAWLVKGQKQFLK